MLLTLALLLCQDGPAGLGPDQSESPAALPAPVDDVATSSLTFQLGYYNHDDGITDGNPFIDEDLTVIEPIIVWDDQVSEDWGYSLELSYDNVSSASIERLNQFPEQSGASGDYYAGARYSSRHRLSTQTQYDWHVGFSFEYDYASIALGGGYSWEEDDGSTTAWSVDGYLDSIDVIRFDGAQDEGSETRTSLAATWSHSRLLDPNWRGDLSVTLSAQNGFLETAYNGVVLEDPGGTPITILDVPVDGTVVNEELPDSRIRLGVSGSARRYLGPGRAVELGGRLYGDDWGITSVALEPRYITSLADDAVALELFYRLYFQTEADDFSEQFLLADGTPEFRTQDPDLAELDSHTVGGLLTLGGQSNTRWRVGLNYTLRSDGLDYLWAWLGYTLAF